MVVDTASLHCASGVSGSLCPCVVCVGMLTQV